MKKRQKEYVAWEGEIYTIEWYFNEQGNSSAKKYFEEMSDRGRDFLAALFIDIADKGKILSKVKFNYEGDKIYAFKPKPDRFLCFFFAESKIIVTNAFEKKQDKLPPREKEKALKLKKDYMDRVKKGVYYD